MISKKKAKKSVINFKDVSVIFGDKPEDALKAAKQGIQREEIQEKYGNSLGVVNCNLTVSEGEILVLMGLSGSGKTTLLRTTNGLNRVTDGVVDILDGEKYVNIADADEKLLRYIRTQLVTKVFQSFGLLPWRNVNDNIGLGLELLGVDKLERAQRIAKQLKLVGLEGLGEKNVGELSGGMQQRVGLARAFITRAPILLMDEPFSALDPLIRHRMQSEMLSFQKELKCTVLFVSHDLDEAIRIGSRISIMEGGRIIQTDTPKNILLNPANDYVRAFVSNVNPLRVLTAKELVDPDKKPLADGVEIQASAPMQEVISALLQGAKQLVVVGKNKKIIGTIDQHNINAALQRDKS